MLFKNSPERWSTINIGLHWLTFLLILGLVPVGLLMDELPNSAFKVQVYALHKSFGLTVLALTLLRLLWRLLAGAAPRLEGTPAWQHALAQTVHAAMYALLLLIPLSGWLYNSASGFPLQWFGLFGLPRLSGYNPEVKEFAHEAHELLFYVLAVLVLLHAAAALKHHYFDRDATLARMLPLAGKRGEAAPAETPPARDYTIR
jgi:cytochrome b561